MVMEVARGQGGEYPCKYSGGFTFTETGGEERPTVVWVLKPVIVFGRLSTHQVGVHPA